MQRQEVANNTPEQVQEYLQAALLLTEALDPPADLRAAVFTQAASLLSGKQIMMLQPQPIQLPAMAVPGSKRH